MEQKKKLYGYKCLSHYLRDAALYESVIQIISTGSLLKESKTFEELMDNLFTMGYEIRSRGKYLSVRASGMKKFMRLATLGKEYTEEKLHKHFMNRGQPISLSDVTVTVNNFN